AEHPDIYDSGWSVSRQRHFHHQQPECPNGEGWSQLPVQLWGGPLLIGEVATSESERKRNAQQTAPPVVAFMNSGTPDTMGCYATAFRNALSEAGYLEGQNVTVATGSRATTIACRRSSATWCAAAWR